MQGTGPVLEPGGEVFGRVLKNHLDGRILVAIAGKRFVVSSTLRLAEGSEHRFQVVSLGPRIALRLLEGPPVDPRKPLDPGTAARAARGRLAGLLQALGAARPSGEAVRGCRQLLRTLDQLLPAVIYRGSGLGGGEWLSRQLLVSGLFWERKLARLVLEGRGGSWRRLAAADLKGLLLTLQRELMLKDTGRELRDALSPRVAEAIHLIEQDQFLNLSSIGEDLGWFWFIPGSPGEGLSRAEVLIRPQVGKEGIGLSVFVEFTRLGELEAAVRMSGGRLKVHILTEDRERASYVERHLAVLEKALQGQGLAVDHIRCRARDGDEGSRGPGTGESPTQPAVDLVI